MSRLRWKICKAFKIPVDDPFFSNMNDLQALWYSHNILLDEEEEYEKIINMIDYHASFINAEGVRKVREIRDGEVVASDIDLEEKVKKGESIFENLDEIKEITRRLKKDTNKNTKSSNHLDMESPLYRIIREEE